MEFLKTELVKTVAYLEHPEYRRHVRKMKELGWTVVSAEKTEEYQVVAIYKRRLEDE